MVVTLGSVSNWSLDLVGPSGGGGGRDPPAALADADLSSGSASHPEADHTTDSFSPAKKEQKLIWQERRKVITGLSKDNGPVGKY